MTNSHSGQAAGAGADRGVTVSHVLGEITWLISQSPLHCNLRVADLAWLVMPALAHKQFHLFRDGDKSIGVALWANLDAEGERKIAEGLLQPGNQLSEADWMAGDRLWLVDLIAPFATAENRHREVMFADLLTGKLKGRAFKTLRLDPAGGERKIVEIAADAGDALVSKIAGGIAK